MVHLLTRVARMARLILWIPCGVVRITLKRLRCLIRRPRLQLLILMMLRSALYRARSSPWSTCGRCLIRILRLAIRLRVVRLRRLTMVCLRRLSLVRRARLMRWRRCGVSTRAWYRSLRRLVMKLRLPLRCLIVRSVRRCLVLSSPCLTCGRTLKLNTLRV